MAEAASSYLNKPIRSETQVRLHRESVRLHARLRGISEAAAELELRAERARTEESKRDSQRAFDAYVAISATVMKRMGW